MGLDGGAKIQFLITLLVDFDLLHQDSVPACVRLRLHTVSRFRTHLDSSVTYLHKSRTLIRQAEKFTLLLAIERHNMNVSVLHIVRSQASFDSSMPLIVQSMKSKTELFVIRAESLGAQSWKGLRWLHNRFQSNQSRTKRASSSSIQYT